MRSICLSYLLLLHISYYKVCVAAASSKLFKDNKSRRHNVFGWDALILQGTISHAK